MRDEYVRLSKFLALMLRHQPEEFDLHLDANGFADVERVLARVQTQFGNRYSREDVMAVIQYTEGGRQRYELHEGRVRARYGHSAVKLEYSAIEPPEFLFHGTTTQALPHIRREGLSGQSRQYVHLSANEHRAREVGKRHGEPVVLRIRAAEAYQAGIVFHNPEPRHYLVRALSPEYIEFPDEP